MRFSSENRMGCSLHPNISPVYARGSSTKVFRLPDLEPVWGMTGLKAVQPVMVVGDTIITGGAAGVAVITVNGEEIHRWPMEAWTQVPILVRPGILVGWESPDWYHYTLVIRRWPDGEVLWRKSGLRFGWLQWSSQHPARFWVMMLDSLLGVSVKTWEEHSVPSITESYPLLVSTGPWWMVAEGTWREDGYIDGVIRILSNPDMRPVDTARVYLGKGGVGWLATAGIRTFPATWWLGEYGHVIHVKADGQVAVDSLGRMPGPWDVWQGYVDGSASYPVLYQDKVIQITRLGRYVLRGRRTPPPGWGEGVPSLRVVFLPRRVRVEGVPAVWKGKIYWLQDMLGRGVVSGRVRGGVLEVGPLQPGVYHLRIGNTWGRKLAVF